MNSHDSDGLVSSTADATARRSYGKLVAFLAARTGDVAAAEDALSEAFAAALADWPRNGCPENPEGWLLTVARRKFIDAARGRRRGEIVAEELRVMAAPAVAEKGPFADRLVGLLARLPTAADDMIQGEAI